MWFLDQQHVLDINLPESQPNPNVPYQFWDADPGSAPSTVLFNDKILVFWSGPRQNGSCYAIHDGQTWEGMYQLIGAGARSGLKDMNLSPTTNACPVVFGNKLYLFYNDSTTTEIWCCATTDGAYWGTQGIWSVSAHIPGGASYALGTSPSAVVYQNQLWLFWIPRTGGGIAYTHSSDGVTWSAAANIATEVPGIAARPNTSPSAVAWHDCIYVFHSGANLDGIWFTTWYGTGWAPTTNVASSVSDMAILDKSSPAASISEDGVFLTLVWTDSTDQGIRQTQTADGHKWLSPPFTLYEMFGRILPGSSPCTVWYESAPYIFWIGGNNDGVWYTVGFPDLDTEDYSDWMSLSLPALKDVQLPQICIPGSHDSGMSSCRNKTPYAEPASVLTQVQDIAGQLAAGARWFDLRPVTGPGSDGYRFAAGHYSNIENVDTIGAWMMDNFAGTFAGARFLNTWQGAQGQSLISMMDDVNAFTKSHNELIILNISHVFDLHDNSNNTAPMPNMDSEQFQSILQMMGGYLTHIVTPAMVASKGNSDLSTWTLGDFLLDSNNKLRPAVLVCWDDNAFSSTWRPSDWVNGTWPMPAAAQFFPNTWQMGLNTGDWCGVTPTLSNGAWTFANPKGANNKFQGLSLDNTPGEDAAIACYFGVDGIIEPFAYFAKAFGADSWMAEALANPSIATTLYMSDVRRRALEPLIYNCYLNKTTGNIPSLISGDAVGVEGPANLTATYWAIKFNEKFYGYKLGRSGPLAAAHPAKLPVEKKVEEAKA